MADADPLMGADTQAAMQSMMADLQRNNPKLAMLAQMMQARTIVPEPMPDNLADEVVRLADKLADAEQRIDAMKRQARRLYATHRSVNERLTDLAAALGACGLCWGEDDGCPSCRGRGRPGMVRPDLELRARLLGPARAQHPDAEQGTTH